MKRLVLATTHVLIGLAFLSIVGFCSCVQASIYLLAIPQSINFVPSDPVLLFQGRDLGNLNALPVIPGNPATDLNDPINAAFSPSGELFVANRHSNVFNGVGSIARFKLDENGNWSPNGVILGNSLEAPHGLAFSQSGELFAANLDNGLISRFIFDAVGK